MKLKLFAFLLFTSISVFGQVTGTAGYINYMNPNRGHEVNIEVKYQLRFVFGEIGLKTSFETRPSSNQRPYYYNGKMFDLVQFGIPINYSKIKYVNAVLEVTIGGFSKNIPITFIERRFSGAGILLCSKLGLNNEECSKYKNKLNYVDVRLKSIEVNTIDYAIEAQLNKIIKNKGGNGTSGTGTGSGTTGTTGTGTGDISDPTNKKLERRPFDEIPDDEYIKPLDGNGHELKPETFSNSKKPNGENPKPTYSEKGWGVKAPVSKIVITKNIVENSKNGANSNNNLEQIEDYYRKGQTYLNNKQYSYAIREFKKALELDPNNSALRADIAKIESLNKKGAPENTQKDDSAKAENDPKSYRDRLKNQQQNFDAKINGIKKGGEYAISSMNLMFQQNASYNAYKSNVEAATRMRNSKDPEEIIRQFDSKLVELERLSQQRYNQLVKEIKAYHAQQSSYNTTELDQAATNLGVALGSMGLSKRIAKEKAASIEKLEGKKREMLTKVKDNLVKDFKKNRENFFRRAASEIAVDKEKYYLDMTKYYQCKIDGVESRFSIDDTDWVNPNCNKVTENYSPSNNSPSDKQLFDASLRKYKNSNSYYQKASKDFVEMAIKANPKKADYYFHRAKFEEMGSKKHISLLMKTFDLNKNYPDVKSLLSESLAEKKRIDETTFFDKNWKITSRKEAFYYRPLVDMQSNPFHVKNYYSSNNQLQMEGFANGLDDKNNALFDGEVIYYFESGEVDSRAYYNKGILKQVLKKNKNGNTKIGFFNGINNPVFVSDNFGKIIDINYWNNGYIKDVKWNYTSGQKKKYNQYLGFNLDERGDLLFRDEYNAKGKLIDRKVEDRIDAMHAASENYIENKEYKEVIKFLENGIVLYPNDALLHYYLGFAESRNENLFSSLNKTINKSVNVSLSNKISKNNEEAIDYFIKGLNLVTNKELELKFYNELGNLYYKVEYFSKSAEIFNKALKIQPRNAPLLNSYSRSLALSTQQLDEAQSMIELCNSIEPNNHNYQDTYAWVLYKKGDFKEANAWLDKAFENGGKVSPIIWEHKGDVSYKLGDKNKAIDCWKTAKSLNKENGGKVSDYLNQKIKKEMLLE